MIAGTASLREIPLFATSSDHSLEKIAGIAHETSFPAGAVVIREGEVGDSLIVIRRGSAVVEQGGLELRRLGAGDFLGEIALLSDAPRTATVTTTSPTRLLVLTDRAFVRVTGSMPSIQASVMKALSERLHADSV